MKSFNPFLPTTPIDYDYRISFDLFEKVDQMIEDAYFVREFKHACQLADTLRDQQRRYIAKNRVWEVYL